MPTKLITSQYRLLLLIVNISNNAKTIQRIHRCGFRHRTGSDVISRLSKIYSPVEHLCSYRVEFSAQDYIVAASVIYLLKEPDHPLNIVMVCCGGELIIDTMNQFRCLPEHAQNRFFVSIRVQDGNITALVTKTPPTDKEVAGMNEFNSFN